MIQHGGVQLIHPEKSGIQPIYDMLNSTGAVFDLFTYKSLKGFMFSLNVNPGNSEYKTLNSTNSRFTEEVTNFILKIVVIAPQNDTSLGKFNQIGKSSESLDSFFDEAKMQQNLWKKSITGGRSAICPPIANYSTFDNSNSLNFLNFLKLKTKPTANKLCLPIIDFLISSIRNGSNTIGILVMPSIVNSATFYSFISRGSDITQAFNNLAAQTVRLLIDYHIIHFDLHTGNSLIYKDSAGVVKCIIIDFGRASNISSSRASAC